MTVERVAGFCFCIVITSVAATGQTGSESTAQEQKGPATSVVERTYATGDLAPWRRVQTRTTSGSRQVVVETFEYPDHGGRLAPTHETVIETSRTPDAARTRRDVFRFSPDGRRTLVEATDSLQETLANRDSRAIHDTSAPDLNGRLSPTSRQIEETRLPAPDVREIHTTLLEPDLNGTLQATERTEYTERPITPGLLRHDSTQSVRDINGRWQPIEARRGEVRDISASERTEEETIQRLDMNQKLAVTERSVTRRSSANGREQVVIEVYAPYTDGSSRLVLSERIHRTTTPAADGGRYTVEEVEGRNNVAPDDPLRVTSRTVTTVRKVGTDRWVTERQAFVRDVNGRLLLVVSDTEEGVGE